MLRRDGNRPTTAAGLAAPDPGLAASAVDEAHLDDVAARAPVTTHARMPSRVSPPWCPVCRSTPGLDCPVAGWTARQGAPAGEASTAALGGRLLTRFLTVRRKPQSAVARIGHSGLIGRRHPVHHQ